MLTGEPPHPGLTPEARAWLDEALAAAAADPAGVAAPFAAAARRCGRAHAKAVRVALLHAARADAATLTGLYQHGTTAERLAVLDALPGLPLGDSALPLVEDALRANDTRLIAAAVGPYAARHLPAPAWRQAVLKCLFTQVPLTRVHRLAERARGDAELARMLRDYARERAAAGRAVPEDLQPALDLATAPEAEES
ncbi:EboA domain-containing protein [Streptomyces sp. TRM 70351]|uniref:EboA domain-containing protein n=1 Tax=Streptomyces sp. TRM 70351 TaxID=3116552 RepID=UPI002E7BD214|nr:EboA domain-containing protein [Streptomyces sp. TRM 70351]MEE1926959.1 EboA domain-containing protein [Streptomyces sp. TRM 70351]